MASSRTHERPQAAEQIGIPPSPYAGIEQGREMSSETLAACSVLARLLTRAQSFGPAEQAHYVFAALSSH